MTFNSLDFAWFLPTVFLLYWFACGKHRGVQNLLLLAASYFFYGWWDWRFLSLLFLSSVIDYAVGIRMETTRSSTTRKLLLAISMTANLGMLGFFKYYGFFVESFTEAFRFFGGTFAASSLSIVLPVGISFYTFQTMSYTIDVYRGSIKATRDPIGFMAFVSFFPQLVAGPIERASNLLPQFQIDRRFHAGQAADGLRQILWGLFKKIVIADNCAGLVSRFFDNPDAWSGSALAIGVVLFAFQIYCDFSGYSDIAIGTSRLFGFNLMRNFAYPYFSRDIAEFWRRWHISLSTWFRDYVYIPLGGSRGSVWIKIRNIMAVFLLSGLWHGANWTYVIWGALNALLFLPLLLSNRNRRNLDDVSSGRRLPAPRDLFAMLTTFGLTCIAWVFFRAENLPHALQYLHGIFSPSLFSIPEIRPVVLGALIAVLVGLEWSARGAQHPLAGWPTRLPRPGRWLVYAGLLALIWFQGNFSEEIEFIYFQF